MNIHYRDNYTQSKQKGKGFRFIVIPKFNNVAASIYYRLINSYNYQHERFIKQGQKYGWVNQLLPKGVIAGHQNLNNSSYNN